MQSEISQTGRGKYCMFALTCGIQKGKTIHRISGCYQGFGMIEQMFTSIYFYTFF